MKDSIKLTRLITKWINNSGKTIKIDDLVNDIDKFYKNKFKGKRVFLLSNKIPADYFQIITRYKKEEYRSNLMEITPEIKNVYLNKLT